MVGCGEVAGVAPGKGLKAEIEDAVEFVEGNAHVETGFCGSETIAAGLLHDGECVEVEPTDGGRIESANGLLFFGFEAGAEGGDAIFDEVQAGAAHDVVFVVVGSGDNFFGDAEGGTDFSAGKFAVFEELEVGGGEFRNDDVVGAPEEEGTIEGAGAAAAIAKCGADLFLLLLGELLIGTDDETGIGVVVHEAVHEGRGGEVGFSGEGGDGEGREAAPEIERVGETIEPDFLGQEDASIQRGIGAGAEVAPANEFVVLDDVLEVRRGAGARELGPRMMSS